MIKKWKRKAIACLTALTLVGTMMPQNPFGIVYEKTATAEVTVPNPVVNLAFDQDGESGYTLMGLTEDEKAVITEDKTRGKVVHTQTVSDEKRSYVKINNPFNSASDLSNGFTISAWVYLNNTTQLNGVWDMLCIDGDADWQYFVISSNGCLYENYGGYYDGKGTPFLKAEEWHLLTYTFTGDNKINAYCDGSLQYSFQNTAGSLIDLVKTENVNFYIGRIHQWWWGPDCLVDDFAIYDTALTSEQVLATVLATAPANECDSITFANKENAQVAAGISFNLDVNVKGKNSGAVTENVTFSNPVNASVEVRKAFNGRECSFSVTPIDAEKQGSVTVTCGNVNKTYSFNVVDSILDIPVMFLDFESGETPQGCKISGDGEIIQNDNKHGKVFHNAQGLRENYLLLPSNVLADAVQYRNELTISMDVNKGTAEKFFHSPLIAAYKDISDPNSNIWRMFQISAKGCVYLNTEDEGGTGSYENLADNDEHTETQKVTTAYLDDAEWHNVTVTFTKEKVIYYIDGEVYNAFNVYHNGFDAFLNNTNNATTNLKNICLGGYHYGDAVFNDPDPAFYFDNVAIYPAALSEEDVKKLGKSYSLDISAENASLMDKDEKLLETETDISHGTTLSFQVNPDEEYQIGKVYYSMGTDVNNKEIQPDEDGFYTIEYVTGNVNITVETTIKLYPITYYIDGEILKETGNLPVSYSANTSIPLELSALTKNGYDFEGWYTADDYKEKVDFSYTIKKTDLTDAGLAFYARWNAKKYTIAIDVSSENVSALKDKAEKDISSISYGQECSFKVVPNDGYAVESVSYSMGSEADVVLPKGDNDYYTILAVTDNVTIKVSTTPKEYEIHYFVDDDEVKDTKLISKYTIETGTVILSDLTKDGYDFNGWYTDEDCTGDTIDSYEVKSTDLSPDGLKFYAKWEAISYKISITKESEEGTVEVSAAGKPIENVGTVPCGELVTVTVKPADEKEAVVEITSDASDFKTNRSDKDGSVIYTFDMPAGDVEISVTFNDASEHTVEVIEKDETKAKITVEPKSGNSGTLVTVTVTPKKEYINDYNSLAIKVLIKDTTTSLETEPVQEVTQDGVLQYTFEIPSQDVTIETDFSDKLLLNDEGRPTTQNNAAVVNYEDKLLVKNGDNLEIAEDLLNPEWKDFTDNLSIDDLPDIVYIRTKGSLIKGEHTLAGKVVEVKIWRTPIVKAEAAAVYGAVLSEIEINGSAVYEEKEVKGSFTWKTPDAKPNAGITDKYIAVFTPKEEGYKVTETVVSLVVEKANPDPTTYKDKIPTGLKAVEGTKLSEIELPEGFEFKSPETIVGTVGENTFPAVFKPSDIDNYNTADIEITVIVTAKETEGDDPVVITYKVELDKEEETIKVGESFTLIPTVTTTGTDKNVTWYSSNEKVATVESGKITAIAAGEVTITATAADNETSASCKVTVVPATQDPEDPKDPEDPIVPVKPVIPEGYNYIFDFEDDITKNGASPITNATGKVEIVKDAERGKVLHITDEGTELFGQNYYKLPGDIFKNVTAETGATIAMWAKIPTGIASEWSVLFSSTPENYNEWNFWKINANLVTGVNAGNPQAWGDTEAKEITKDAWHQITATLTKDILSVYVDGKLVAEKKPAAEGAATYTGPLEQFAKNMFNVLGAGGIPTNAGKTMDRDISNCYYDDVVIYPTALTAKKVEQLYTGIPTEEEKPVPVTGITLNKKEITLEVGDSETLTAAITPEDATNKGVQWSSDDKTIATIDGNGKVTAIAVGNTRIKATSVFDSSITTSCAVTVKQKSGNPGDDNNNDNNDNNNNNNDNNDNNDNNNPTIPGGSTNNGGGSSGGSSSSVGTTTPNTNPSDNNTENQTPENTPSNGNNTQEPSNTTTTKPDGTVVETSKETTADGTVKETVKETAADGAVKETIKETAADGVVKETVKETIADNSVTKEKITETAANGSVTMEATVTDQKNAAVLNAVVEKDANGNVTKANAVISAGAADVTVTGKKASVDVNVSDVIMNAAAESDGINSVVIEITKPVLSSAYANENVTNGVTVNVNIDTVDDVAIAGIVLTSESIAEAKAAGQKLTVNVITGDADYKVVIPAKQLKKITDTTKPIDIMVETVAANKLANDSSKGKVSADVKNVLSKSKAKQNKTYVLSVAENKDLKAGMKVTAKVNKDTSISPNQTVYVYKYNEKTGKFVEVANSKQTVSADGTVSIDAKSGTDYVVSSKKLSGNKVTTIKSQIKATIGKSSVKAGKSISINVDLPATLKEVKSFGGSSTFGKEQAIVLYESSDNKVAQVTAKGTIKAKKAGKATITITVGTEGGQTKKIKKTITVK